MNKIKVKFIKKKNMCLTHTDTRFYMNNEQFVKYFLSPNFEYEFIDDDEKADINIYSIRYPKTQFNKDGINILLSIENLSYWKSINHKCYRVYYHHKNFGDYGNKDIDIFFYNHISTLIKPDSNSLSIPVIYNRINYFKNMESYYENHDSFTAGTILNDTI